MAPRSHPAIPRGPPFRFDRPARIRFDRATSHHPSEISFCTFARSPISISVNGTTVSASAIRPGCSPVSSPPIPWSTARWQPASPPPPIWDRAPLVRRAAWDNSVRSRPVERPKKTPFGRSTQRSELRARKHGQRALTATYNMRRFSETVALFAFESAAAKVKVLCTQEVPFPGDFLGFLRQREAQVSQFAILPALRPPRPVHRISDPLQATRWKKSSKRFDSRSPSQRTACASARR